MHLEGVGEWSAQSYLDLIRFAARFGFLGQLIVPPGSAKEPGVLRDSEWLRSVAGATVSRVREWPGTRLLGRKATALRFELSPTTCSWLGDQVHSPYAW